MTAKKEAYYLKSDGTVMEEPGYQRGLWRRDEKTGRITLMQRKGAFFYTLGSADSSDAYRSQKFDPDTGTSEKEEIKIGKVTNLFGQEVPLEAVYVDPVNHDAAEIMAGDLSQIDLRHLEPSKGNQEPDILYHWVRNSIANGDISVEDVNKRIQTQVDRRKLLFGEQDATYKSYNRVMAALNRIYYEMNVPRENRFIVEEDEQVFPPVDDPSQSVDQPEQPEDPHEGFPMDDVDPMDGFPPAGDEQDRQAPADADEMESAGGKPDNSHEASEKDTNPEQSKEEKGQKMEREDELEKLRKDREEAESRIDSLKTDLEEKKAAKDEAMEMAEKTTGRQNRMWNDRAKDLEGQVKAVEKEQKELTKKVRGIDKDIKGLEKQKAEKAFSTPSEDAKAVETQKEELAGKADTSKEKVSKIDNDITAYRKKMAEMSKEMKEKAEQIKSLQSMLKEQAQTIAERDKSLKEMKVPAGELKDVEVINSINDISRENTGFFKTVKGAMIELRDNARDYIEAAHEQHEFDKAVSSVDRMQERFILGQPLRDAQQSFRSFFAEHEHSLAQKFGDLAEHLHQKYKGIEVGKEYGRTGEWNHNIDLTESQQKRVTFLATIANRLEDRALAHALAYHDQYEQVTGRTASIDEHTMELSADRNAEYDETVAAYKEQYAKRLKKMNPIVEKAMERKKNMELAEKAKEHKPERRNDELYKPAAVEIFHEGEMEKIKEAVDRIYGDQSDGRQEPAEDANDQHEFILYRDKDDGRFLVLMHDEADESGRGYPVWFNEERIAEASIYPEDHPDFLEKVGPVPDDLKQMIINTVPYYFMQKEIEKNRKMMRNIDKDADILGKFDAEQVNGGKIPDDYYKNLEKEKAPYENAIAELDSKLKELYPEKPDITPILRGLSLMVDQHREKAVPDGTIEKTVESVVSEERPDGDVAAVQEPLSELKNDTEERVQKEYREMSDSYREQYQSRAGQTNPIVAKAMEQRDTRSRSDNTEERKPAEKEKAKTAPKKASQTQPDGTER